MKKLGVLVIALAVLSTTCFGKQGGKELGVSFSYLFPKNGYFSSPVAPLAIRGVGVSMSDYMSLGTGVSWYNIAGVQIVNMPTPSVTNKPLLGPLNTFLFPLELKIKLPLGKHRLELIGGGFLFFNATSRINEGNMDREFLAQKALTDQPWTVLNGEYKMTNHLGMGYDFGASLVIYVKKKIGLTFKAMYLIGDMPIDLRGTISGYDQEHNYRTESFNYKGSAMDITGWELSVGAVFTGK